MDVHVVKLEPMRVACARVVSRTPERDAWEKLQAWALQRGLLDDPANHTVFGFNNPNPSPDRTEYGYEFWIKVDSSITGESGIELGVVAALATSRVQNLSGHPDSGWLSLCIAPSEEDDTRSSGLS